MSGRRNVRRYSDADRNDVWRVHDAALRDSTLDFSPEYNRYLRHVDSEFLAVGGEFLVVTVTSDAEPVESERVVGIGGYQPLAYLADTYEEVGLPSLDASVADTCRVRSVAVLPEFQSNGIGTELMAELEERATGSGFEQVVLKTADSLKRARQFYESRGYRAVDGTDESDPNHRWYLKKLVD